ncbi:ABC transporter ATP-binding protein [Guggenheimella bovis]
MKEKLLDIQNLSVEYRTDDGIYKVLNDVCLEVMEGETLGLVGETGAGKTTTALSVMKLLPKKTGFVTGGEIHFSNEGNLLEVSEEKMKAIRGHQISMIFQDPMTSLNPIIRIGDQIKESFKVHRKDLSEDQINNKVDEMLQLVGISPTRKHEYPHQFSGGMKQRVVIAMALSLEPKLLIADEPTTALDVTIQAQVLQMMNDLKEKLGTSMILITHDLGVVSQTCEKVAVMYAGHIIEYGTAEEIFLSTVHHPYTDGLFGSIPDISSETERLSPIFGLMPEPTDLPDGCVFHPRCPKCMEICKSVEPQTFLLGGLHQIKCHLYKEAAHE